MCKLLLLCLFSFSFTQASQCYKDLCVGDIVRDQFGWRGSVYSFNLETQEVAVALSHIPSIWNFKYDELGVKVRCHKWICESDKVVDKYEEEVEVIEVFTNGLVYIFDISIDGYLLYQIDELRPKD